MLILLALLFLKLNYGKTVFQADNVAGNTSGNLLNGGLFCELDSKIYFSNPNADGSLYVMNSDLTNIKKIHNDKAVYINGAGKYIIYSRVNNTKESNTQNILVFNSVGIYRVDRNGSNITMLDDNPSGLINVYGNYVYYQQYTVKNAMQLYQVKIDNTKRKILSKEAFLPSTISDGKMYYTSLQSNHNINVMDLAEVSSSPLYEGNYMNPIVNGNYIYYISLADNYAIARMKLGESEPTILVKDRCSTYNISESGKYLYYQVDDTQNNRICRMNLETMEETIIKEGNYNHIHVTSNYVFFQEFDTTHTYVLPAGEQGEATDFVTK